MKPAIPGAQVDDWEWTLRVSRWHGLYQFRSKSLGTYIWTRPGYMEGTSNIPMPTWVVNEDGDLEEAS